MSFHQAGDAWRSPALFMPAALTGWLTDPHSLTSRIRRRCGRMTVVPLRQRTAVPGRDERNALKVAPGRAVRVREVLLCADGVPVVFAHSIVRLDDLRGVWRLFSGIGHRPLGDALFADHRVVRSPLAARRLAPEHALHRRIRALDLAPDRPLWARRSLFMRHGRPLLVTEVFLPAIMELAR